MKPWPSRATRSSRMLDRFALAGGRVPTEHAVLLHRFEREQTRQRRVVADLERRVGRAVLGLQLVEEITRVHVERIVLFHGAARIVHHVHLDGRLAATPGAAWPRAT